MISLVDDTASAYPFVQPIKAALYFDSAEGFGQWRILISTNADTDLRKMRKKATALFKVILKKIRELSWGHFSPDNQKQLTENAEIPIYEAKMTGDSRLVYQIDCVPEFETNVERQVIRIFGIYSHAQLNRRLWDSIGNQLGQRGKEYRSRCVFRGRPIQAGKHAGTILPSSWPALAEDEHITSTSALQVPNVHKDDEDKVTSMLGVSSSFNATPRQALLNSLLADQDVMHVFDVSTQEKDIIEYPRSCYVLGRSGTGKTTSMLFKMLGIERSWQACEGALVKPRQVFVTQSRVLAEKVQEFFAKLHGSLLMADKSPEELRSMKTTRNLQQDHDQDLVDLDEEVQYRGDLPQRFSELADEHFPLFVTFDQLCRLLEAEFPPSKSSSVPPDDISVEAVGDVPSNDYMEQLRDSFVSYQVFLGSYWAHFPQSLTKGLDPALVFAEIMGVIKGSEHSLTSEHGFLDKPSYLSLSHRTQATFANQRNVIYDLFLAYLKQKRRRGEWDAADRTHHILTTMQSQGLPGKQLDFLYVDEAQDNLLIDALILRSICRNADTGLFWAGDTAQTISIGSAFRFNDLKAFLYRVEVPQSNGESRLGPRHQPHTFQLAVNYRSHAGIVDCAHSVIELITMFWPYAIDHLAPERGLVQGATPIFLGGWDENIERYKRFLFGDSTEHLKYGAHQCILVRHDAARKRLRAQVGNIGTILTIYEAKGLEYNDVLLYNFFSDSTVELSQWRIVLDALSGGGDTALKSLQIDYSRYIGLCRELKFLYVAITRAQKNVWIADTSDKCEPMRHFWAAKGHIQVCTPSSGISPLATSSTPEELAKSAHALFDNKQYMEAMYCYERAGLFRDRSVAEAYHLREAALTTPTSFRGDNAARVVAFRRAAEAFWSLGLEAANAKRSYFRIAAKCFFPEGNDLARAAEAYFYAEQYTESASLYRRAGMFNKAVAVIKSHRNYVDPGVVETIIDVSRLQYLRNRKIKQARLLFDSDEDALEYMDDHGLDRAQVMFLEQLGRLSDAAQVHLDAGRIAEAIPLLLKDYGSADAAVKASHWLLDGLRRKLSFGIKPTSDATRSDTVLQGLCHILHSQALEKAKLDDNIRDELLMFRAIVLSDAPRLLGLSEQFRQRHKDVASALRSLDHAFMVMPKLKAASLPEIVDSLHHFSIYVELLRVFASAANLCDDEGIRRLFAVQAATDDFFLIPKDTFLFGRCARRWTQGSRRNDQGVLVLKSELHRLLQQALQERLCMKVREENDLCHRTHAFQVCLPFFTSGTCFRAECPQDHVAAKDYGADSYNLRIRVHLQQIAIYNSVRTLENRFEQAQQHQYWLSQLYEALNPSFYKLGTVCSLRPLTIPEYNDAIQIVRKWVLDWLYDLSPYDKQQGLTKTFLTALMATISLGLTFGSGELRYHLSRVPFVTAYGCKALVRGNGNMKFNAYIAQDLERWVYNMHPASLASGILFVNHILVNRLPVNIVVLCGFLDSLAGLLIVASRLNGANTLHDLTMPRSWLQRVLPSAHQLRDKSTRLVYLYMEPMANLLEQIYTQDNAGHLLFGSSDLSKRGWHVRNVFLARICRNLCLLGDNSHYRWLKDNVHHTITSLRRPGREFNRIYQRYVDAPAWEALAKEVRDNSTTNSPFDEMVQLYHAKAGQSQFPPRQNVRRVVYNDIREILALLAPGATATPQPRSGLGRGAAPSVPHQVHVSQADNSPTTTAGEPAEDVHENDEEEANEEDDADVVPPVVDLNDESLAFEAPDPAEAQLAQEKLNAAQVFADAYLRARRKRGTAPTTPAAAIHLRFANAYRATYTYDWVKSLEKPQKRYRLLLLVPLPYCMAFLELACNYLYETNNRLKRRLQTVDHLELEKVLKEMTRCRNQRKEAIRLNKALEPGASMHKKRDGEELRARMREVEQLAASLPSSVTAEWDFYLKTAVDGILKLKPRPTKKPKPELNMADDDMVDYADGAWSDDE
ncbi:uncharacterized protein B0H18DRAFT_929734 [Fomitopsis serialis]|uniref:uncharacterized protein n=1 Tax=Fomitopsis serialis TaxID=139415 RepID=UPI002007AF93|nr:uncharacterized protein B0H18DRAFT_929734 [Neoantrodia serialis]KAH9931251.1 hypothetical protein B0H18DRAFT_929734 [Neoantrodia serialis]